MILLRVSCLLLSSSYYPYSSEHVAFARYFLFLVFFGKLLLSYLVSCLTWLASRFCDTDVLTSDLVNLISYLDLTLPPQIEISSFIGTLLFRSLPTAAIITTFKLTPCSSNYRRAIITDPIMIKQTTTDPTSKNQIHNVSKPFAENQ
jgi:hypothetical protein